MAVQPVPTPNRKTSYALDPDDVALLEPPYAFRKEADKVDADLGTSNVTVDRNLKFWSLKSYQEELGTMSQRSEAASSILALSTFTAHSSMVEVNTQRSPTDLTGATTGANANLNTQGDKFIEQRVAAGGSFDKNLSADQTAYPGPDASNDTIKMDRTLVSTLDLSQERQITFRWHVAGKESDAAGQLYRFYFNGPASWDNTFEGYGQYCLFIGGDGSALLSERGKWTGTNKGAYVQGNEYWVIKGEWQYCPKARAMNSSNRVIIRLQPYQAVYTGAATGAAISFTTTTTNESYQSSSMLSYQVNSPTETSSFLLKVRNTKPPGTSPPPTKAAKVRVDENRSIRGRVQISKTGYYPSGTLVDSYITLPFYPSGAKNLLVVMNCLIPSGCSLTPTLYAITDSSGKDAAVALTLLSGVNGVYTYALPSSYYGIRTFQVKFDFAGTGTATPFLYSYSLQRDGTTALINPGETKPLYAKLRQVSLSGGESDPSHETGRLRISDLGNELASKLNVRGAIPIRVETQYDPNDTSKKVVLFRGQIERSDATRRGTVATAGAFGGSARVWPDPNWRDYDCTLIGRWARAAEQYSNVRFPFNSDPATFDSSTGATQPWKVTDAIKTVFTWAGWPFDFANPTADSNMVDNFDYPIRFFPQDAETSIMEPGTQLMDWVMRVARDYLGRTLDMEHNMGTYGKWQLVDVPYAPYTAVAAFTSDPPTGGKLRMHLPSYDTGGIPTAPIVKNTYHAWVRKPLANRILVSGTGFSLRRPHTLSQCLVNFKSYNAYPGLVTADPTSPDYIGHEVPFALTLANLQNFNACDWVCRRLYDLYAHGVKMLTFTAPLIFVPSSQSGKKRKLRYYDVVTVDGQTFLVRNVNPDYTKDNFQMAVYELESPRF